MKKIIIVFYAIVKYVVVKFAKMLCWLSKGSCRVVSVSTKGALKVGGETITLMK